MTQNLLFGASHAQLCLICSLFYPRYSLNCSGREHLECFYSLTYLPLIVQLSHPLCCENLCHTFHYSFAALSADVVIFCMSVSLHLCLLHAVTASSVSFSSSNSLLPCSFRRFDTCVFLYFYFARQQKKTKIEHEVRCTKSKVDETSQNTL